MNPLLFATLALASSALAADNLPAALPPYYAVKYEASEKLGELGVGVTYTLWVPPGAKTLRGVIVHQHGCGISSGMSGLTAAYDLHWQALARKWNCALLGPAYHLKANNECRKWCDPRNGSDVTFQRALAHFAVESNHPELTTAPWCLWGHSGGGFWSSLMLTLHPERIAAIFFR
jgi:poly(3-hydroxybutyrate) depolymerase